MCQQQYVVEETVTFMGHVSVAGWNRGGDSLKRQSRNSFLCIFSHWQRCMQPTSGLIFFHILAGRNPAENNFSKWTKLNHTIDFVLHEELK